MKKFIAYFKPKSLDTKVGTVLAFIAIVTAIVIAVVMLSLRCAPVKYLTEKYDFDKKDLKCVEYHPKHYYLDFDNWCSGWTDNTWEYEYQGTVFLVKKIDGVYYDDYQFDEYYNWCLDYLKTNVDENISALYINSKYFLQSSKKLNENNFKSVLNFDNHIYINVTLSDFEKYKNNEELAFIIGESISDRFKELNPNLCCEILLVDETVETAKTINYLADRCYYSEYYTTESIQDLCEQGRLMYANKEELR